MVQSAWWARFFAGSRRQRRGALKELGKPGLRREERLEERCLLAADVLLPGVPEDLFVSWGDGTATLSWTAPADNGAVVADYVAEFSNDLGTSWQAYDDGVSIDPSMTIADLVNGSSYVFRVAAVDDSQQAGDWSAQSDPVTPAGLPGPPSGVVVSRGNGSVDLAWTAPAFENGAAVTSFVIESSENGEPWGFAADVAVESFTTIGGLVNGASYVFRVAAVNAVGQGEYSDASELVVPAGAPVAPIELSVSRGDGSVDVSWQIPPTDNGAAVQGYVLEYSLDDGESWVQIEAEGALLATTSLTVAALENGSSYVFRVAAVNDVGQGEYSDWSSPVTPAGVPDAPGDLGTTRGDGAVMLSWTEPAGHGAGVSDYVIRYSEDEGLSWTDYDDGVSTETIATVGGLVAGMSYVFQVAAVNDVGQGAWTESTVPTAPLAAPDQPLGVLVTGGNRRGMVTWSAPADDGGSPIVGYVVEYRRTGDAEWIAVPDTAIDGNAAVIAGLTNGTAYEVRVAAVSEFATGLANAPIRFTPLPPPTKVQGRALPGTLAGGSVRLSWVAVPGPANLPVIDYVIEASADGGATWAAQADGTSRLTTSLVGGLINGTTYLFRVAAVTAAGRGDFSAPSAAVTPFLNAPAAVPAAPTGLVGVGGRGSVSLNWEAPPRNAGGPVIDYVIRFRLDAPGARWFTYPTAMSADVTAMLRRLSPGQTFVFQVAARNLAGLSAFSAGVTVRAA
jgi:titin